MGAKESVEAAKYSAQNWNNHEVRTSFHNSLAHGVFAYPLPLVNVMCGRHLSLNILINTKSRKTFTKSFQHHKKSTLHAYTFK